MQSQVGVIKVYHIFVLCTAESTIPLQPFPGLGWGVIHHKQTHSCCFIGCLLFFRWVALLILFCNQFSKDILQVHHSVFQCFCGSKNIQDLVSDVKTFQAQLKRLLFTTCRLGKICSAAYSLGFNWLACQPPFVASK